ncbi:hypothetical protein PAXRUDRAFT_175984, partial [Paxillus rubicundulus Ve08.2h10]
IMMPHNLLIVDYSMGNPGSAHDAHALQSTHIYEEQDTLLAQDEWIWGECIPTYNMACCTIQEAMGWSPEQESVNLQLFPVQGNFKTYPPNIKLNLKHRFESK